MMNEKFEEEKITTEIKLRVNVYRFAKELEHINFDMIFSIIS